MPHVTFEHMGRHHVLSTLAGVCFTLADLAYLKLSELEYEASTLGPLTSMYIVIPVLLGHFLLAEPLGFRKLLGIFFAIPAMYFLST